MADRDKRLLFIFFLLGLAVRVAYVLVSPLLRFPDEERFWCQALSLAGNGTLGCWGERAHDMPLTAAVLAGVEMVTGGGPRWGMLAMALASAGLVPVVAVTAARIRPGRASLVLAGAWTALYPFFIFYSALLLSESLFLFLCSLMFCELLGESPAGQVRTGLWAGLAHLARPTLMYFMPLVWAYQVAVRKVPVKNVAASAAIFCVFVAGWGLRNTMVLGSFTAGTTGFGQVLWEGNNPWNESGGVSAPHWGYLDDMPEGLSEVERDAWKKDKAVSHIIENPGRFAAVSLRRLARFWNLWPNAPGYGAGLYKWVSLASFGPALALALAGLFLSAGHWKQTLPLWLFILYLTALHAVTIGSIRYRLPLEPLLIAMASAAGAALLAGARQSSCPKS